MNISQIFGKKIVSTSGKHGYVISAYAEKGKMVYLLCADGDEREFNVDFKDIVKIGNEIIYDDRAQSVKNAKPLRLGRAGFDETGKLLGIVEDYVFKAEKLVSVKIGKKNYPAERITVGDAVIVKDVKKVKSDVLKDGKVIIKKGTPLTDEILTKAADMGEYIQTNFKSL